MLLLQQKWLTTCDIDKMSFSLLLKNGFKEYLKKQLHEHDLIIFELLLTFSRTTPYKDTN